ncbi:hypothetical protein [Aureimonas sp. SA4125]|uniref:hypothetical protein n=1 Tax=Aureimonas sp. SA4125 TaxID=2826993 RepID=UPI001CC7BA7D|nr:hypothetical protein [Aureimonas sp. SA4125]
MSEPSTGPSRHESGDDARTREAAAILHRINEETSPQIGAGTGRLLSNTWGHLSAVDADRDDPIEVLGTRIGRILGFIAFLAMAVSLVLYLMRS